MRLKSGLLVVLCAIAACSPHSARDAGAATAPAEGARHPESGLAIVALSVIHAGQRHAFRVELAQSRIDQARGLMFRRSMGADEGMLFPMDPPRVASFWMRNTVIPLDIIFIGPDRTILNISANAVPYSEEQLVSDGPVIAVLELNGGRATELGLAPGDRVEW